MNKMTIEQKTAFLQNSVALIRLNERVGNAMEIITKYGGIDGAHHKAWVIDQTARALLGDEYAAWVASIRGGEDGSLAYEYDEGIAP